MAIKKQFTIFDLRFTKSLRIPDDLVNRAQRAPAKIVNPIVLLIYTLLTALMNERPLSRTMGNVFGPDTQPSADLIHHFRELIGYNNGRRTLSINRTVLAYAMYYLFYNEFMIPDETR